MWPPWLARSAACGWVLWCLQHPVFGKIIAGYDVCVKISNVPTSNDNPIKPVMMQTVTIEGC
jgi:cyclophilin family peptidyl-prolyl cis-trans isomerase